jgi:predicted nuclease of predicted toxin-antitoxin system
MSERYLANENFPAVIVRELRAQGDDVRHAAETMVGVSDAVVLDAAIRESRVLLTFDRDFGELVFHRRHPPAPGIVLFRFGVQAPDVILQSLRGFFAVKPILRGFFSVVSPGRIRQTPLMHAGTP